MVFEGQAHLPVFLLVVRRREADHFAPGFVRAARGNERHSRGGARDQDDAAAADGLAEPVRQVLLSPGACRADAPITPAVLFIPGMKACGMRDARCGTGNAIMDLHEKHGLFLPGPGFVVAQSLFAAYPHEYPIYSAF